MPPASLRRPRRAAPLVLVALLLGWLPCSADVTAEVEAELRLGRAAEAGDREGLLRLFRDRALPGSARAKALWAAYARLRPPLESRDRVPLLEALADPAAPVRRAALRAIGRLGERPLEREALKRAAEDPEAGVRVEALRAVRGWSRQGHLYFLERALAAPDPRVRAEALGNLARISWREVPPEIIARVEAQAAESPASAEKGRALEALQAWGRLRWEMVRGLLADREAPEALRLVALRLSDAVEAAGERDAVLLDLLAVEPTPVLAWEAFRRLRSSASAESALAPAAARYLTHTQRRDAATEEMAAFLRERGYRIEFRSGSWKVTAR